MFSNLPYLLPKIPLTKLIAFWLMGARHIYHLGNLGDRTVAKLGSLRIFCNQSTPPPSLFERTESVVNLTGLAEAARDVVLRHGNLGEVSKLAM